MTSVAIAMCACTGVVHIYSLYVHMHIHNISCTTNSELLNSIYTHIVVL